MLMGHSTAFSIYSLVLECWEVPGSIPSQGLPPRQPSVRVLVSSVGGPGFNPQPRTAS